MSGVLFTVEEMDKLLLLNKVRDRILTQSEAAKALRISERQVRRLVKRTADEGAIGIKSKAKGGNRAFDAEFKQSVIEIVRNKYHDFGPTLSSEMLEKHDGLKINKETLRLLMMEAGIWKGRSRKQARIHQSRERRSQFGELVQIDGSHHDWFEGRAPKCCLLVFIDDATSRLVGLRFEPTETTLGYMNLIQDHLTSYGRPLAYYSDKHSIFKTTREHCIDGRLEPTQLHRALNTLKIELICAHSSQAKGRVERANKTLQDRLIKEMRLRGISSIEQANAFMPEFIKAYNAKFARVPADPQDAHRPLLHERNALRQVLSVQTARKLSKNLEFSLHRKTYQITSQGKGYRLRHKTVTVCEHVDSTQEVFAGEQKLEFRVYQEKGNQPYIADTKDLNHLMDHIINKSNGTIGHTNQIAAA